MWLVLPERAKGSGARTKIENSGRPAANERGVGVPGLAAFAAAGKRRQRGSWPGLALVRLRSLIFDA